MALAKGSSLQNFLVLCSNRDTGYTKSVMTIRALNASNAYKVLRRRRVALPSINVFNEHFELFDGFKVVWRGSLAMLSTKKEL